MSADSAGGTGRDPHIALSLQWLLCDMVLKMYPQILVLKESVNQIGL
jgi:hypothetical protein